MVLSTVRETFDSDIQIPTLPAIAVKILEAVRDENASFDALGGIIISDPMIAAKVLKMANSSFYGLRKKVTTIKQAVSILGLNTLKNIALSFVVVGSMKGLETGGFDFEFFWKRAVTAAVAADLVAKSIMSNNNEAFIWGLLQDIGVVILFFNRKEEYSRVLDEKKSRRKPINILEKETFGFDHQDVGGKVLQQWGFPESIFQPIRFHHNSHNIPEEYRAQAHIVQLSDRISAVYHGTDAARNFHEIKAALKDRYGFGEEKAQDLIDSVAHRSNEVISSFEIKGKVLKPFSQILQEANDELTKLNFSYEHLAMQYKRDKEKMEHLARALEAANEKLRNLAFRDELTGLFNQRHFSSSLGNELQRALRYHRPLSLVLLDLDYFKRINDNYGHRAGDIVLRSMGRILSTQARNTDTACRYGGEEFAIICPETDMESAVVMAERVREAIEGNEFSIDGTIIEITVSIGVTGYFPGTEAKTSDDIFQAADRALYQSKRDGRNRVTCESA